jgi:phage terminase large subunit-like protein
MSSNGLRDETAFSVTEQEELKLAAHVALARKEFVPFATLINKAYLTPHHVRVLGGYLDAVERGDITRLIITMPPRHSKSESVTGTFVSQYIGKDPTRCVMIVCHSADLAETFSIQNRQIIAQNPMWPLVFPDIHLSKNRKRADIWAVNHYRENVIANGIMGGLTGYGANLIIFDDPVKTYEQANSPTYREKVFNEYKTAARTRLTPDGAIIIIMTRWHEDDLAGRILASEEGPAWTVLHFPALSYGVPEDYAYMNEAEYTRYTERLPRTAYPDPLGRHRNEPLWPSRWPYEFLIDQRLALGHEFEALYQGHPSAPEGNKFKNENFRSITPATLAALNPRPEAQYRSWDLAWSGDARADYTAGVRATLYVANKDSAEALELHRKLNIPQVFLVLEDCQWWQKEWDDNEPAIIDIAEADGDKYYLLVEAIASQNIGWKSLKKNNRMWKHTIVPIQTKKDKEACANYPLKLTSSGMVFILQENPAAYPRWATELLKELGAFPNAKNDDKSDAFFQIVNHLQPRIDTLLAKYSLRQWNSGFNAKQTPTGFMKDLPPEFQQNPRGGWVRKKLGWVK